MGISVKELSRRVREAYSILRGGHVIKEYKYVREDHNIITIGAESLYNSISYLSCDEYEGIINILKERCISELSHSIVSNNLVKYDVTTEMVDDRYPVIKCRATLNVVDRRIP